MLDSGGDTNEMNFSDPEKISTVINRMKEADLTRAQNRANIQRLFNGEKPYTDQQAIENSIQTNVNFLEGTRIMHDARSQWNNAFLKKNFFTVSLTKGDPLKRQTYGNQIGANINRIMKNSAEYMETFQAVGANIFLHGPGPSMWEKSDKWCPKAIGIEDLKLPSNTLKSFSNLSHFAIWKEFSYGELYKLTHGNKVDPRWNMEAVNAALSEIKNQNTEFNNIDIANNPEAFAEKMKANLGYYDSDAVPTIKAWEFYFHDDENDWWNKRIILDCATKVDTQKEFLYQKDNYAKKHSEIIHVQFADGANKAPFYYYSIRSLGWLLYDVCRLQNRLRSKFNDQVFGDMLWLFYVGSPEDRDRLQKIDLYHMGVMPDGARFVPAAERFQPRADLIQMAMSQNRQNMSENSSSFTQDVNDGTQKEMTATETMARVNSASSMVSAMLNLAYGYEKFRYNEICRRFCIKNSDDPEVKKFQEKCKRDGIPDELMDVEFWEIEPEKTLGAGNKMLQIAQSDKLMAARAAYDPDAQREILHIFTEVNTDDPQLANRLVPLKKPEINDAIMEAQWASGALMQGLPVAIKQGINHIDYVEALLVAMQSVIGRIEESGGMATAQEILGLQNVANHLQQHMQIIAQDESQQQRVKQYGDSLGKMMNMVKAYGQRLQEQMQKQAEASQVDPAAMAKVQAEQAKLGMEQAAHAQDMIQRQQEFEADQKRKNAEFLQRLQQESAKTQVDILLKQEETAAKVKQQNATQSKTAVQ